MSVFLQLIVIYLTVSEKFTKRVYMDVNLTQVLETPQERICR